MKRILAPVLLAFLAGACALPTVPPPAPLPGEARVKKVDRLSFQDPPEPNLYRVEFDALRSKALRERASLESPGDRSDPYHAFMQFFEQAAEQEMKSRGLCSGTAKLVSTVDGVNGTGPLSAVFACRPAIF